MIRDVKLFLSSPLACPKNSRLCVLRRRARALAAAEGIMFESVVRGCLMFRAGRRGLAVVSDRSVRSRLAGIARELDVLPGKVHHRRKPAWARKMSSKQQKFALRR